MEEGCVELEAISDGLFSEGGKEDTVINRKANGEHTYETEVGSWGCGKNAVSMGSGTETTKRTEEEAAGRENCCLPKTHTE